MRCRHRWSLRDSLRAAARWFQALWALAWPSKALKHGKKNPGHEALLRLKTQHRFWNYRQPAWGGWNQGDVIPSPTSCLKSGAALSDSCQPQSALVLKVGRTLITLNSSAASHWASLCPHFKGFRNRQLSATTFFATLSNYRPLGAAQYNDSHYWWPLESFTDAAGR